jgi:hypothetical protein
MPCPLGCLLLVLTTARDLPGGPGWPVHLNPTYVRIVNATCRHAVDPSVCEVNVQPPVPPRSLISSFLMRRNPNYLNNNEINGCKFVHSGVDGPPMPAMRAILC